MTLTDDQRAELAAVLRATPASTNAIVPALAPLIERFIREAQAEAWDEGFDAGERDALDHDHFTGDTPCVANPYREAQWPAMTGTGGS